MEELLAQFPEQKKRTREKGLYEFILDSCYKGLIDHKDNKSLLAIDEGVIHIVKRLFLGISYQIVCDKVLKQDAVQKKSESNKHVKPAPVPVRRKYITSEEQFEALMSISRSVNKEEPNYMATFVMSRALKLANHYFRARIVGKDLFTYIILTAQEKIATLKTKNIVNEYKVVLRVVEALDKGNSWTDVANNLYLYNDGYAPKNEAKRREMPTSEEMRTFRYNSQLQLDRLNIMMRYILEKKDMPKKVEQIICYILDLQIKYFEEEKNSRFCFFDYLIQTATAQRDRTSKENLREKYDISARIITALLNDAHPLILGSRLVKYGDIDTLKSESNLINR